MKKLMWIKYFIFLFVCPFISCLATNKQNQEPIKDFYLTSVYKDGVNKSHPYARKSDRGNYFVDVNILIREDVPLNKALQAIVDEYDPNSVYLWNTLSIGGAFNLKLYHKGGSSFNHLTKTIYQDITNNGKTDVPIWAFSIFTTKEEMQTLVNKDDNCSIYSVPIAALDIKTGIDFGEQNGKSVLFVDKNGEIAWTTIKEYVKRMPPSTSLSNKLKPLYAKRENEDLLNYFNRIQEIYKSNEPSFFETHRDKLELFFIVLIIISIVWVASLSSSEEKNEDNNADDEDYDDY